MEQTNYIGLDNAKATQIAEQLNELLSDYQIFTMNVRGYHWNIQGIGFFTIHKKFEEIYDTLSDQCDELAERILTLGHKPFHSFSQYLKHSSIQEDVNVVDIKQSLQQVLKGFQSLLIKQRKIIALAQEYADEGTVAILSNYITEQEKLVWMLHATTI